jgi:pathogenesis-related protein 1
MKMTKNSCLVKLAVVLVLSVGVTFSAGEASPETGSALDENEVKALLDFHNEKRGEVKVPEVAWSKELAAFAQEWADHIAELGKFQHRPVKGEFKQRYGESIAEGPGKFGVTDAGRAWYNEKKAYDSGKQSLPANAKEIGHYTQMVWNTTRKIGAGKATVKKGKMKGWTFVVCNYDPPGNAVGKKPFE